MFPQDENLYTKTKTNQQPEQTAKNLGYRALSTSANQNITINIPREKNPKNGC